MESDFSNVNIKNEAEFIEFVENLNIDIEFANISRSTKEQEHILDLNYLIKRYREIKPKVDAKVFKERYDCKYCLYYERPRRCFETEKCPLDEHGALKPLPEPKKCIRDKDGTCPYGRGIEACIGYCIKDIVEEHRKQWAYRYVETASRKE